MSVGAKSPSPKNETRAGASAFAYSSWKTTCCANAAVPRGPRQPDPAAAPEQPLPREARVPTRLVGGAAPSAERRELAGEVLGQPGLHLRAEGRLLGRVAEVHAACDGTGPHGQVSRWTARG